jgi:hypothetical protein
MRSQPHRQPLPQIGPRAEPEICWRYCERIEPGEYRAHSRSASTYVDGLFQRWVCSVQFDILTNSLLDVVARLTWYLNLGSRDRPHAGRRGKFWRAWVIANAGVPKRRDRLSPRVFVGRFARVLVEDTQHDFKGISEPENAYSVVRDVLRWETGAPTR